jgi:putative heme-binding domain-containing protein
MPKQRPEEIVAGLLKLGNDEKASAGVRLNGLAAVPGGIGKVEPALFTFLRAQLDPDQPVVTRALAADILSRARLTSEQLVMLTDSFKTIGPMEVDRVLEAFAQSGDETVGRSLIVALKAAPVRPALRVEMLKPRLAKFGPPVQQLAEELYAALNADAAQQTARLEQLLTSLASGDIRRGQAVFNSSKAACSTCHAVGYLGGKVGPDLTRIGTIRNERDLLEAIVFPNASFVRSYEPVVVATKEGRIFNGVLRKDAPEEIILATGADQEVRIARDDIEQMQPSKVSIMPSGLDQQLSPGDLADLVAFLKACK